jgi:hypothetical protein
MYQHCGIECSRGKNKRLSVKNRSSNTVRLNVHMFNIFNTPQYHSFPLKRYTYIVWLTPACHDYIHSRVHTRW